MDTEVTIIGAGVTGMTMAALLIKSNISVSLVDKRKELDFSEDELFSGRTAALNLFSRNIFEDLNLWEEMSSYATPFKEIRVWDASGSSKVKFEASEFNLQDLGSVISNNALSKLLSNSNKINPKFSFFGDSTLDSINETTNGIKIVLKEGKSLRSKLLIGADGGLSSVRNMTGIKIKSWSYNQKACVATLLTEKRHRNIARQVFTPSGPIALLPFNDKKINRVSLVWSIDNESVDEIAALSRKDFSLLLESKVEGVLGKLSVVDEINYFPLNQLHVEKYFIGRVVVIGDAAHTIHPLAGQGLNLGIADAEALSRNLIIAKRQAKDLSSFKVLQMFNDERFMANMKMVGLMEIFKRGFQAKNPWIKFARNLVFNKTNQTDFLKKKFIKEATGI